MDHFDKGIVGADRWLMMLGTLSGNPVAAVAGLKDDGDPAPRRGL